MPLNPDPDDVAQEVALQRLLGRRTSARHVRLRMLRTDRQRQEAERGHVRPEPTPTIDPVRFPILHDKLVRKLSTGELLQTHGCRSKQTLSRKVRAEVERYQREERG